MNIQVHQVDSQEIAEATADYVLIKNIEDGLDLMGNIYYLGYDKLIIHQEHITPDFFDLKTGVAGEILQKFSNYRVRLAIVGDFSRYESNSLKDFIFESNKQKHINFVSSVTEAVARLSA